MQLKEYRRQFDPRDACTLEVSVHPAGSRTIVVGAGPFHYNGQDYVLAEEEHFDVPEQPFGATLLIYLVKEKATGDVRVLFDLDPKDGSDPPYEFQPTSPLEGIYRLALLDIPTGTGPLDDIKGKWMTLGPPLPPAPLPDPGPGVLPPQQDDPPSPSSPIELAKLFSQMVGNPANVSAADRARFQQFVAKHSKEKK